MNVKLIRISTGEEVVAELVKSLLNLSLSEMDLWFFLKHRVLVLCLGQQ